MAEEILVKEPLRSEQIAAGKELTRVLAGSDLQLVACFWLYTSETNEWRLILATPVVDAEGPKKTYALIRQTLTASSDPSLSLLNISVQSPQNPLVQSIRLSYDLDLKVSGGLRLSRTRVGDVFIEDAYLYFVPPSIRG